MKAFTPQYADLNLARKYIERIVDGDTVVTDDGEKYRLYGIDAPESKQEYGQISTAALASFIAESEGVVWVQYHGKEKYGRMLATLYSPFTDTTNVNINPVNINYKMVLYGHAWAYRFKNEEHHKASPQPNLDTYDSAETVARLTRLGLWSSLNNDVMPERPSVYRRRIKKERKEKRNKSKNRVHRRKH